MRSFYTAKAYCMVEISKRRFILGQEQSLIWRFLVGQREYYFRMQLSLTFRQRMSNAVVLLQNLQHYN